MDLSVPCFFVKSQATDASRPQRAAKDPGRARPSSGNQADPVKAGRSLGLVCPQSQTVYKPDQFPL
jgi:hypothetical protein